jgi:hypothetical protein
MIHKSIGGGNELGTSWERVGKSKIRIPSIVIRFVVVQFLGPKPMLGCGLWRVDVHQQTATPTTYFCTLSLTFLFVYMLCRTKLRNYATICIASRASLTYHTEQQCNSSTRLDLRFTFTAPFVFRLPPR